MGASLTFTAGGKVCYQIVEGIIYEYTSYLNTEIQKACNLY
jgi:hypothetical protein